MLLLVDGHGILYRAYHAMPPLRAPDGRPTQAVYGFINILHKLLKQFNPPYVAVTFDVARKTFRQDLYPPYKAHRKPMPEDLKSQIPILHDILDAMRVYRVELEDYEADDIIATLATQAAQDGDRVLIASSDKDLFQLLSPTTHLWHPRKEKILTPENLPVEFGLPPEKVVDYLALVGDSSDNIPGVPGVGDKTAKKLLDTYGSLENILAHMEELPTKLREKFKENKENILLFRQLVTLKRDLPLPLDREVLKNQEPAWDDLIYLYRDLGFQSLLKEMSPPEEKSEIVWKEGLPEKGQEISIRFQAHRIYGWAKNQGFQGTWNREWENYITKAPKVIIHDAKPLYHNISKLSSLAPQKVVDLLLLAYCYDPGDSRLDIPSLIQRFLKEKPPAPQESLRYYPTLAEQLYRLLEKENLVELYETVEAPLTPVLVHMEKAGIHINLSQIQHLTQRVEKLMEEVSRKIYQYVGHSFNLNSPKQVREVFFEELQLPLPEKRTTKTKALSTSETVLENLADQGFQIAEDLLTYRRLAKLKGTYLEPLPGWVKDDGRVHSVFHQTVTATGRLSSSDPNLQNIPIRGEWGEDIRKAFTAPSGYLLVAADYSQIELRLLAHFSQDPVLMDAFEKGQDIHAATASAIFGVPIEDVTPDLRRRAKTVNFGILYGMSAHGLAQALKIERRDAQEIIDAYFKGFPRVRAYLDQILKEARETQKVHTLLGRIRRIPEIHASSYPVRANAERMAINAPLQGSASDIIKMAMVKLWDALIKNSRDIKLILQIHDELLFETPEAMAKDVATQVKKMMESIVALRVPLTVSVGVGSDWQALK